MSLINTLQSSSIKDLLRAFNSSKDYLFFNVSVFNAGVCISINCTDSYKDINPNTWNGYDFIIENDNTTKYYILQVLKELLNDFTLNKTESEVKKINKILKANS